ncbi:MAG: LptA/OstA family protein [Myxococcota bacterium]|jgi:lipopolysaccharide transport protein LptA|nr:LptA/OstA family protein [Myxococcota bacterium]
MRSPTWSAVHALIAIAAFLGWSLTAGAIEPVAEDVPSILVAPFVAGAPVEPPAVAPRVESRLAARFVGLAEGRGRAAYDVTRAEAVELEADEVRSRAKEEGADYVLVGRWLPAAERDAEAGVLLNLELRSGHSGATEQRYTLRFEAGEPTPDALEAEVSRVALAMIDDLGLVEPLAPVASGPGDESPPAKRKRTDFLRVERDQPIEINSEDLELRAIGKTKHLIFRREVKVVQGDMQMFAGYLEAFYPEGASQPDRLDAREAVRLREGDLEVRCREATYLRDEERVICKGDALLVQGCDEVRGHEIEFHIEEERVEVKGAASVVLHLEEEEEGDDRCAGGGAG